MKRTIKIHFVDFWNGFDPKENFFIKRLEVYYTVILDSEPDYLFYSLNGTENLKYNNCIKIYFSGENDVPDFNLCDYAIAFHHITFEDRYLRLPLYALYKCFEDVTDAEIDFNDIPKLLDRKFCSFVVSNSTGADPIREQFFKKLSEYKKVDSGGRFLNNIGQPVSDKLEFIKDYKFTLAFENSTSPGYTTEKLIEPMAVSSIPIYWGNPVVHLDFNKKSFVCVNDFESVDEAIREIIRLDTDDEAYIQMLSESYFNQGHKNHKEWVESFDSFICNIVNQPIENAKRNTEYGYAKHYRKRKYIVEKICSIPGLKYIIRKLSYVP